MAEISGQPLSFLALLSVGTKAAGRCQHRFWRLRAGGTRQSWLRGQKLGRPGPVPLLLVGLFALSSNG
jgi:hypothetical protein